MELKLDNLLQDIMFKLTPEAIAIQNKMEQIALILMKHENKNFCLAKISPLQWKRLTYRVGEFERSFIVVPSHAFLRLILDREYLKIVDGHSELFGTGNDWNVIRALKDYDKNRLVREYSDREFLDYIQGETMAYVFKVYGGEKISNRILRLDLCRGIDERNTFRGGIFHVFKHFTPQGYDTISSRPKEWETETFSEIFRHIILNFFSDDFEKESDKCYIAKSLLEDGHILRGVYYKEDNIPVAFIKSIRIDGK